MRVTWTPEQIKAVADAERDAAKRAQEWANELTGADLADFIEWWAREHPGDFLDVIQEWQGEDE